MEKVILVRIGEIALKGLNRSTFENKLAANMRKAMASCGRFDIVWSQSRFYVNGRDDFDIDRAVENLSKVFGIVSLSVAAVTETNYDLIRDAAYKLVEEKLRFEKELTFKVEAKRGQKSFPMTSPQIAADLGGFLLESFPSLKVDVINPDFIVYVEVREKSYVYTDIISSQGGMPTGSNGKGLLLLSGGIDSPVAGYMLAKRGIELACIHYHSYPYTSERAKGKVIELARILTRYCGNIRLYIIPFTDIQLEINQNCKDVLSTVIMRRSMMRIAEKIAKKTGAMALITGESLGQVASQTIHAINCTDSAANMPVFRPLIGMDKMEVTDIARRIDTYETSIQPYEDCCTIFTPKHPKTKPGLEEVIEEEARVDFEALENTAAENAEIIYLP